jgi:hypothetical protein
MKYNFEWPMRTMSGTRDKTTYMSFWDYICIGRRWVMPIATPQQATFKAIAQNLTTIWKGANPLYKADFKTYAHKFKTEHMSPYDFPPRSYAVFINMMYAWRDTDPTHIDLSTVTRADIISQSAPVKSVFDAVDAELMPTVTGYKDLDNLIQV